MPQSNWTHAPQLLSLCSRAWEPQLPKISYSSAQAPQQEKPPQWEASAPQLESSPWLLQLQKSLHSNEDPAKRKKQKKEKRKGIFGSTVKFSICRATLSPLPQLRRVHPAIVLLSATHPDRKPAQEQSHWSRLHPLLTAWHPIPTQPLQSGRGWLYGLCVSLMAMLLLLLSRFSRVRLCDPMDSNPPGSSVHRIFQARILAWVAISFSSLWSYMHIWPMFVCKHRYDMAKQMHAPEEAQEQISLLGTAACASPRREKQPNPMCRPEGPRTSV